MVINILTAHQKKEGKTEMTFRAKALVVFSLSFRYSQHFNVLLYNICFQHRLHNYVLMRVRYTGYFLLQSTEFYSFQLLIFLHACNSYHFLFIFVMNVIFLFIELFCKIIIIDATVYNCVQQFLISDAYYYTTRKYSCHEEF